MNAKEANKTPIPSYLNRLGIKPSKVKGDSLFYLSPYREENTPSFKVSNAKNLWVDYGDGNAGGTLIDLVLKLNPTYSISDAIKEISGIGGHSFSFHKPVSSLVQPVKGDETPGITVIRTKPLGSNRAITDYLHSRCVSLETAKNFCREVYYSIGDKRYFGLGNEHENGWAIRNKYWKGCSAQGFSYYKNQSDTLCLFEGIFDLMSYVELQKNEKKREDFIVLNSLGNLKDVFPEIPKYDRVDLYLDRDIAGEKASRLLMDSFSRCSDRSSFALPYKDLNEYLVEAEKNKLKR